MDIIEKLKGKIVVSVQAMSDEPLYKEECMLAMMKSVVTGGAGGLRVAGARDVRNARQFNLPVIGLTKPDKLPENWRESVYITPGIKEVNSLIEAGADIIAFDGTSRPHDGCLVEEIIDTMKVLPEAGYTAKTMTKILLDECNKLYEEKPGDDTTACVVRIRKREPMNLLFGPPSNRDDCDKMMSLFFSKEGKHIICGGTTSSIAAKYLGKPIIPSLNYSDPKIPPTAEIEGVDLVTEGVITINRVLEYAKDYLANNESYVNWCYKKDGASLIARLLFEEATDINFFVGRAINPAHQNPNLPINFSIKMQLVNELTNCLKQMGKNIKVSYF